jgi:hypothetical protein
MTIPGALWIVLLVGLPLLAEWLTQNFGMTPWAAPVAALLLIVVKVAQVLRESESATGGGNEEMMYEAAPEPSKAQRILWGSGGIWAHQFCSTRWLTHATHSNLESASPPMAGAATWALITVALPAHRLWLWLMAWWMCPLTIRRDTDGTSFCGTPHCAVTHSMGISASARSK